MILSRNRGESIVIYDDIKITVIEIRRDKVRLGIECPKTIPVNRQEIWLAIKENERRERDNPGWNMPLPPADRFER